MCSALCQPVLHWIGLFSSLWSCPFCVSLLWPVLVCSALFQWVFQLSWGNGLFSFPWKGKAHCPNQRGTALYGQKSMPLVPDWFVLMQMRTPNPRSLHLSKRHYSALIGHWRCWRGYSCTAPVGWGKPQSFWLNKVLLVWLNRIPGAPL